LVLCTGATRPRDLAVEGRNLEGVHFAMDYLTASTRALLDGGPDASPLHARGKNVVVIGGGDTGTDCVGTAVRQGCRSLVQFEILPRPPMDRADDNPWPEWPKVYKLDYGQEEAAAVFGGDPRVYITTVKSLVGDAQGRLRSMVTVRVRWDRHADGQFVPVEQPGTEEEQPAEFALLAMGFLGPEAGLLRDLGVERDPRGNVFADHGKFATSVQGVFAAGDCRRGQSLVVWAINEGRGAARECDRYLMGGTQLP
ncbi:MAG: FAD-dependent oxidoreductase, partial [Steroidobacteraceae bacterium]